MGNILDIRDYLRANVSDELLAATTKKVIGSNRDAARGIGADVEDGKYTKHVARDLFPQVRRARIETCFFGLVSQFPDITVTSQLNKTGTNYHTRIRSGNLIMTASAVLTPRGLAREADFRNNYAGPQLRFDIDSHQNLSQVAMDSSMYSELLYGIILYCAAKNNPFEIGSVHLAFPDTTCTRYQDCVDLMNLFPETTKKTEVEQVQDQAIVNLLVDDEEIFTQRREVTTEGVI